jgi:hypothetical protein
MITDAYDLPLTLADLATAVTGGAPRLRRDLLERRLAHWSNTGVLETLGPVNTGRGKSRLFRREQSYVAGLLLRLADFGLSIAALRFVGRAIVDARGRVKDFADRWDEAKLHGQPRCIFLTLGVVLDDAGENPISLSMNLLPGAGALLTPAPFEWHTDSILINVSDVFRRIHPP